ncbi:hypothetical protein GCM10027605_48390 [Micromonospora zhanjiangensis]
MNAVSPARRREVLDALRRGAVPAAGLDLFAVGLDRFTAAIGDDLATVAAGGAVFKAVRGEYGSGKTFFTRWIAEQAKRANLATAEVQISENETPLHKLETVYRRLTERLATSAFPPSALRPVVDGWFYALEEDALAAGRSAPTTPPVSIGPSRRCSTSGSPRSAAPRRPSPRRCAATGPPPLPASRPRRTRCSPGSVVSRTSRPRPAGSRAYAETSTTSRPSASCKGC